MPFANFSKISPPLAIVLLVSPTSQSLAEAGPKSDLRAKTEEELRDEKVQEVRQRAIAYLKSQQRRQGGFWTGFSNWEKGTLSLIQEGWETGLATTALLENGVSPTDLAVARALLYLRKLESEYTTIVGLQTQALCLAKQPQDADQIKRNLRRLEAAAARGPKNEIVGWSNKGPPTGRFELFLTRVVVAALWMADTAGIKVEGKSTWADIREGAIRSQSKGGGWNQVGTDPVQNYERTITGLFCLLAAEQALGERDGATEKAVAAGQTWIGSNYRLAMPRVDAFTLADEGQLGRLTGGKWLDPEKKRHDWYQLGLGKIVPSQSVTGRLQTGGTFDSFDVLSTALALRFLACRPD
jgi:hypothetical protein